MENINELNLHDGILRNVSINPTNCVINFEVDCIIGLSDTEEVNAFKPIRKKAIVNFINYKKACFDFTCDIKNSEIILDFKLLVTDKEDQFHFHVYTSNNSRFDISCEKYNIILVGEETIEETLIIIPK